MSLYIARPAATALAASTARTIVQIVSGGRKLYLKEVGVSFDGTDASKAPVLVDLVRQSTAGTSSTLTIVDNDGSSDSTSATARSGFSGTEPTSGDIIRSWYITPAGGLWVMQFPLGDEPVVDFAGDTRLGLRCTTSTGVTPNVQAYIVFSE